MPKNETFLGLGSLYEFGLLRSWTIEILSSLYGLIIPLFVLAAYAIIAPHGFDEIFDGLMVGILDS